MMKILVPFTVGVAALFITSISSATVIDYSATLSAAQSVPPTSNAGTGTATLQFDDVTKQLTGTVTFSGVASTTGDITGGGPCGANGGSGIAALSAPTGTTFTVPVTTVGAFGEGMLIGGGAYVELYAAGQPGDRIRGQIYAVGSGKTCAGGDAGAPLADSGTSTPDSGTSTPDSGTPTPDSGTPTPDSGTPAPGALPDGSPASSGDAGGCSAAPSNACSGGGLVLALALGLAAVRRARSKKR